MNNNKHLLSRVQEALAKEANLTRCLDNIYFLVNDGAVIMGGTVANQSLRRLAIKIVTGVSGVALLIDDLKIDANVSHGTGVQIDWARGALLPI